MTITNIETKNHFRAVSEVGSMAFVVKGLSYRITIGDVTAVFTKVEASDIIRMESWIAYYSLPKWQRR